LISFISSIRLTTARIIPHNRAKYRSRSIMPVKNNIVIPIYHEKVIANPPLLGVGLSCRLLLFGTTSIFFCVEYLIIK